MRLVCPNCSAQYEIDGSMIPEDGRDVQCSNCGHTWFELPGPAGAEADTAVELDTSETPSDDFGRSDYDPEEEDAFDEIAEETLTSRVETQPANLSREEFEEEETATWAQDDTASEDEEDANDRTTSAVRAVTAAADESTDATDDFGQDAPTDENTGWDTSDDDEPAEENTEDDEADPSPAIAPGTPRRPADAAALDILREEAERELSQRRAPPSEAFETQTDLGLEDIRNRRTPSRALRARMAHLGEEPTEETQEDTPEPSPNKTRLVSQGMPQATEEEEAYEEPRRDLLPDIEEINSTLKSPPPGVGDPAARKRSGFRIGFLTMVFLAGAAIFAYAQAPAIARALPETENSLISYVDWANGVRDQIDALIGN